MYFGRTGEGKRENLVEDNSCSEDEEEERETSASERVEHYFLEDLY